MIFDSVTEAFEWLEDLVDDDCVDNFRFAYLDDVEAMKVYEDQKSEGCCGSTDSEIKINDRPAMIGCNYGH